MRTFPCLSRTTYLLETGDDLLHVDQLAGVGGEREIHFHAAHVHGVTRHSARAARDGACRDDAGALMLKLRTHAHSVKRSKKPIRFYYYNFDYKLYIYKVRILFLHNIIIIL